MHHRQLSYKRQGRAAENMIVLTQDLIRAEKLSPMVMVLITQVQTPNTTGIAIETAMELSANDCDT